MSTSRRCHVCQKPVVLEDCRYCPECGAPLSSSRPSARDEDVQDILRTVRDHIDGLDGADPEEPAAEPSEQDRNVAAILSNLDFPTFRGTSPSQAGEQSSYGDARDDGAPVDDRPAGPASEPPDKVKTASPDNPPAAFGRVLASMRRQDSAEQPEDTSSHAAEVRHDRGEESAPAGFDIEDYEDPFDVTGEDAGREEPPLKRSWWGSTRQTLYLLLLLLASIVLFRIFVPAKKEPTIEDFFRPGNPDIEFLDAINFLEKYYQRHPELRSGRKTQPLDETASVGVQPPRASKEDAGASSAVSDNATGRESADALGRAQP